MPETTMHCPGCKGYTRGWVAECPGVSGDLASLDADFIVPHVVPPLRLLDRLRVLAGRPVLMGVAAGPVSEPFEVIPDDPGRAA